MGKLLIAGTVAFDSIESPFGSVTQELGGAATYIALAASKFQLQSGIVSVVGNDFPEHYLDMLFRRGVDITGVERRQNGKTFSWGGRYENDMNKRETLYTDVNVLSDFEPSVPKDFLESDIVMLGNLHPVVQKEVLDQLVSKPKLVVLDTMNYWMDNTWSELMEVLKKVDVITINDEEARQLTGEYSLAKAALRIYELGPSHVVIKKGENGALLFHKESIFFAPALPLEDILDPTGAGDTFAGGFVGYLTRHKNISFNSMKNAIIYGSVLASFCVERFGTERLLHVSDEQIHKRLSEFKMLTQFEMEFS